MTDFVRVSLPNGHEATFGRAYAEANDLDVIDAPATNSRGLPLPASRKDGRPAKRKTSVSKEAAKKAANKKSETPASADESTNGGVAATPEEATK